MIPLDHLTYPATKVKGEISMSGKVGGQETFNRPAHRDPNGRVNARLHEPKYPRCKERFLDTKVDIQGSQIPGLSLRPGLNMLHGRQVTMSNLKGTKWAPKPF
jgi:hypothetical protein